MSGRVVEIRQQLKLFYQLWVCTRTLLMETLSQMVVNHSSLDTLNTNTGQYHGDETKTHVVLEHLGIGDIVQVYWEGEHEWLEAV